MLETKENYVDAFMTKHNTAINKMSNKTYDQSNVALSAFKSIVKLALDNAYISYTSKNKKNEYLEPYLYGALKLTNHKIINENRTDALICPGCRENKHIEILSLTSDALCCANCCKELENLSNNETNNLLHRTFANHSVLGFKCPKCSKYLPEQMNSDEIFCPYKNCDFKGNQLSLQRMSHPTVKIDRFKINSNLEHLPETISTGASRLLIREDIDAAYKIINECIDEQIKTLHFKGFPATYVIKLCMYKAFKSGLNKSPEEVIPYLSNGGRMNGGAKIQSKLFQEFISFLEESLPFSYIQKNTKYNINSLLNEELKIFDGESVFNSEIKDNFEVPNLTQEIYIGGRSGYYCQPYYIGKLLDIIDIETNQSILNTVKEYTCIKICMDPTKTKPGTKVRIRHLRIPPHYQMGGFSHMNRLKKVLSDKVQIKLKDIK